MKQLIFLSLFLLLTTPLAAQKFYEHKYRNNFNFSVLSLMADNPGFEFGYERKYGNWSTLVTYTILSDAAALPGFRGKPDTAYFGHYGGYRVSLEQRYFFPQQRVLMPYLSLFGSWLKSEYIISDRFGPNPGYLDTFAVNRANLVISPRFGIQIHLNRLLIDTGVGFGLKWRQTRNTGRQNPADKPSPNLIYSIIPILPRDGKEIEGLNISFPVNVRLAFQF
ncbi:hypothetical protein [Chitinophaga sp.]|uniref:hypothetical protein n=1 Tax=Chitinophaga sp. TaxID=1869181 RepID=UPI0031DC0B1F